MKQKLMKVPEKDQLRKNPNVHFDVHCAYVERVSLILYAFYSLKPSF